MAVIGISASIDVSKIDKEKLIKGKKGTYLNITAFVDIENKDQYDNNGMVTQSVTSEEREAGTRGVILGNTKVFFQGESKQNKPKQNTSSLQVESFEDLSDDIPFSIVLGLALIMMGAVSILCWLYLLYLLINKGVKLCLPHKKKWF